MRLWGTKECEQLTGVSGSLLTHWLGKYWITAAVPPSGRGKRVMYNLAEVLRIQAMRCCRVTGFTMGQTLAIADRLDNLPLDLGTYLLVTLDSSGGVIGFENSQQVPLIATEFGELICFPFSHWRQEAEALLHETKGEKLSRKYERKLRKIGDRYEMA